MKKKRQFKIQNYGSFHYVYDITNQLRVKMIRGFRFRGEAESYIRGVEYDSK